jgi:hypothetical protein
MIVSTILRGTRKSIDVGDGSMTMKRNQEKHQIITVWEGEGKWDWERSDKFVGRQDITNK